MPPHPTHPSTLVLPGRLRRPDTVAHAPPGSRDPHHVRNDAGQTQPRGRRSGGLLVWGQRGPWTVNCKHGRGARPSRSTRPWGREGGAGALRGIYLCPGAFPGTPPPPRSRRRCSATFFLAAEESPTSEGLQTKRFWSLAEEKLAGFQCSWQTLGGLHFSICRREQKCVCLHRLMAPPPRRPPPPAHRHYWRGWALEGVRLPVRSECKCYVIHYQM